MNIPAAKSRRSSYYSVPIHNIRYGVKTLPTNNWAIATAEVN